MQKPTEIQVHRIWTDYKVDPTDPARMVEVDMVSFGPVGGGDRSITMERISRLSRLQEDDGAGNPAIAMARHRWASIQPYYEAYKAGKTMVVDGTPLAAWNALTPEQGEVLRLRGVQTVEQLSKLTDAHVQRFGIPGLKSLIDMAALYVTGSDTTRTTAELAGLKDENAALREQLAELTQLVKEKLSESAPAKRK